MKAIKIPYQKTQKCSPLVSDYLSGVDALKPYYNRLPSLENFSEQIIEKSAHKVDRKTLVSVLKTQNSELSLSELTSNNINALLDEGTFTVTTGHQLCLFTGPLYFVYKIISTINLTHSLKEKYPDKHFVPVFWMASEDHDFEEVNHVNLFGKMLEWDAKQKGAVGCMSLEGIGAVLDELDIVLGASENAKSLSALFADAYLKHANLADASRFLVNALFGKYGLVALDGDDANLKKQFVSIIKKDVLHQGFFEAISNCSDSLGEKYKVQAHPRSVNFFYLSDQARERINASVLESEIEQYPERFSPNVLMRPLYQETILPNLAYVGGEAELAYWMQLKTAFQQENIPFPILVLRNSVLWVDPKPLAKWKALNFEPIDFFKEEHQLHRRYVNEQTDLDISEAFTSLKEIFEDVLLKVVDEGLRSAVLAEHKKQQKSFEKLEKKLLKFEKKKHEVALHQISKLKADLFPNGGLQERFDNFIPYYLKHGENFVKILQEELNPLEPNFVILGHNNI